MRRPFIAIALAITLLLAVSACSLFSGDEKVPLPGERVSVLELDKRLQPSPEMEGVEVQLPPPDKNIEWAQAGGNAQHDMQHLRLSGQNLTIRWRTDIGAGSTSAQRILSEPIIYEGVLYALDAEGLVSAVSTADGALLWQVSPENDDEDDSQFGGGIAAGEEKIFVTTPYGHVIALDAKSGKEIWNVRATAPFRAAPALSDGRLFAMTIDNQINVFATDDGKTLWTNVGAEQSAGLLGGSTPAVAGPIVVAPYTTGELIAFDVVNGRTIWGDSLAGATTGSQIASFSDIRGRPTISDNIVYAIGNGGVAAAVPLSRGGRMWDSSVGSTQSPWVAGDFIYIVTNNAELICMGRENGKIKWVQALPRFVDPDDPDEPIYWAGPVLASDRILMTDSTGYIYSFSPYTGEALGKIELPAPTHVPPVVAGETLFVLLDNGEVIALQ